jgi:H+/gluconate symporter-like permease
LVGFDAVIAALPAFTLVSDWVLSIEGGPLVSLAIATNILSALTGSASGGPDYRARSTRRELSEARANEQASIQSFCTASR